MPKLKMTSSSLIARYVIDGRKFAAIEKRREENRHSSSERRELKQRQYRRELTKTAGNSKFNHLSFVERGKPDSSEKKKPFWMRSREPT